MKLFITCFNNSASFTNCSGYNRVDVFLIIGSSPLAQKIFRISYATNAYISDFLLFPTGLVPQRYWVLFPVVLLAVLTCKVSSSPLGVFKYASSTSCCTKMQEMPAKANLDRARNSPALPILLLCVEPLINLVCLSCSVREAMFATIYSASDF